MSRPLRRVQLGGAGRQGETGGQRERRFALGFGQGGQRGGIGRRRALLARGRVTLPQSAGTCLPDDGREEVVLRTLAQPRGLLQAALRFLIALLLLEGFRL